MMGWVILGAVMLASVAAAIAVYQAGRYMDEDF